MLTIARPWRPSDLRTNIVTHYTSEVPNNHFYIPLVDGYMEEDGYDAWTANDCVLSKETSNPHSGTKCLRVTFGAGISYANQAILTVNGYYRATGCARGVSGIGKPVLYLGGSSSVWVGTTSTDWQVFNTYGKANASTSFSLLIDAIGSVEWDDLTVERVYILDGDCELSGVTSWTAVAGATLSKETTLPHSGTQCLRISGGGMKGTKQSVLTNGSVYHMTGYVRSDGTNYPVVVHNSVYYFIGTSSTNWQAFDFIFKAVGTDIAFWTSGGYSELDDIVLEPAYITDGNMEDIPTPAPTLVDLDMEAVDCAAWLEWNITASKQTIDPEEGSRYLRLTYDGANVEGCAYQSELTHGKYYHVTGWARGDGITTSYPYLNMGDVNNWEGTTSNTWQYFDVVGICNGTDINLSGIALEIDGYVEWDNITVRNATATYYTAYQSVLSKRIINPNSGSQSLRVAYDGVNASGIAYQATLTIGQTYLVTGYARGDGTVVPIVYIGTGTPAVWTGTSSTDWQAFSVTGVATNANLGLGCGTLASTRYVEFDDIIVANISGVALTDISNNRRNINQGTLAKQPGIIPNALNGHAVSRLDGTDDYLKLAFPYEQPETILMVCTPPDSGGAAYIFDGEAVNTGALTFFGSGTDQFSLQASEAGIISASGAPSMPSFIYAQINGDVSAISVNGGALVTGDTGLNNMNAITLGAAGDLLAFTAVDIAEVVAVSRPLTDLEQKRANTYYKRKFDL